MGLEHWIQHWAATDRVAFIFEGQAVTYAALAERVHASRVGLAELGVCSGDRVGFCGLNRVEMFETFFACVELGALLVPLNNRLTAAELAWQIGNSRPRVILTTDGFGDLVAEAVAAADQPGGEVYLRDLDVAPFNGMSDAGSGSAAAPSTDVLMVYTSGTTGRPKGAVLTSDAIVHTAMNGIERQDIASGDVVLTCIPVFHVGGFNIQTMPALFVGATVVLHRRFDPQAVLDDIVRYGVTHTVLVPPMLIAVAELGEFTDADLSSLKSITTGSSVVPAMCMRPYVLRDVPVIQVYGATETGPTSIASSVEDAADHADSCGRVAIHTQARVVRPTSGSDVRPGVDGEIWVKGANVFDRYWDDEEATKEAFVDGWFRTGDVGRCDAEGFFWVTDRLKDLIITGGENVYPAEVEAVLAEHPAIDAIAIIGTVDERWGEAVTAVVELAGEQLLDLEELRSFGAGSLARYKLPRRLRLCAGLPRTALGKVRKHELRDELA